MRKIKDKIIICKECSRTFSHSNNYSADGQPLYCSAICRSHGKSKNMKGKNVGKRPDILGANNPNYGGIYSVRKRPFTNGVCMVCSLEFTYVFDTSRKPRKFCSVSCKIVGCSRMMFEYSKKTSRVWPDRTYEMSRAPYKLWRKAVFDRDGYTCQHCGEKGGRLNADHIMKWSDYPELRYDVSNGRTLCQDCHRETPNFGNRKQRLQEKLDD